MHRRDPGNGLQRGARSARRADADRLTPTLVLQSFRADGRPAWLGECTRSVSDWAAARGYAYRFLGDELFDGVPRWYTERAGGLVLPRTDLGRLQWMRRLLAEEAGRVIWIDADVLVFDPGAFEVPERHDAVAVAEIWVYRDPEGGVGVDRKVNNSVLAFTRAGLPKLERLIELTESRIRELDDPGRLAGGTAILTGAHEGLGMHLLERVGCFGPGVVRELIKGEGPLLGALRELAAEPFAAANLCRSMSRPEPGRKAATSDAKLERAVAVLQQIGRATATP